MAITSKKELPPITRKPYDAENAHLSKEDYLKKQRRQKELQAKMKAYEEKAKAEIEAEDGVTEVVQEQEDKPKVGRPKKL